MDKVGVKGCLCSILPARYLADEGSICFYYLSNYSDAVGIFIGNADYDTGIPDQFVNSRPRDKLARTCVTHLPNAYHNLTQANPRYRGILLQRSILAHSLVASSRMQPQPSPPGPVIDIICSSHNWHNLCNNCWPMSSPSPPSLDSQFSPKQTLLFPVMNTKSGEKRPGLTSIRLQG
jgi:hypothetical protein